MAGRTRATSNSPTGHGGRHANNNGEDSGDFKYESLIGGSGGSLVGEGEGQEYGSTKAAEALSNRLTTFRDWLEDEAGVTVHPSICIVNGEATDGTKNAPVLAFGPPPGSLNALNKKANAANGRVGLVDSEVDRALYDRTMGCCIRTTKEIKKDEVILTMPRKAMVTPDLVAASDAGKAVLACCQRPANASSEAGLSFWDGFENTTISESKFSQKVQRNTGPQFLVKILHERKRAHTAYDKAIQSMDQQAADGGDPTYQLAPSGSISTRAPLLAFLIHQRFSNRFSPPVSSSEDVVKDELERAKDSALVGAKDTTKPPGSPASFAPYVRTLPSAVSLPLSWKRNELAFLAGCHPGIGPLQEVAVTTLQLAAEFIALLDAGILHRFPATFPRGLITWERWMWAASCVQSRMLPASCYLDKGDADAYAHVPRNKLEFQSPAEIWNELGVMIPLLDMVNHEAEANQVTWEPCVPSSSNSDGGNGMEVDNDEAHPPRAILHQKVRKGSQVYSNYGAYSNDKMLLQYGFAQLGNPLDKARLGWGLSDAVGNIEKPRDYKSPYEHNNSTTNIAWGVYDTVDQEKVKAWWTEDRLALLEREAFGQSGDSFTMLKNGKKMMASAYCDGTYHPILLTVAVIGTMPPADVETNAKSGSKVVIELSKAHQRVLRDYFTYTFSRKLEKLLHNTQEGLKAHFAMLKLWTKATEGGIRYNLEEVEGVESEYTGWQSFFDQHAYTTTLEAENRYYALGADTCALALIDGQLRSLQASMDGFESSEKFEAGPLRQLKQLDFKLSTKEEDGNPPDMMVKEEPSEKSMDVDDTANNAAEVKREDSPTTSSDNNDRNGKSNNDQERPDDDKGNVKMEDQPKEGPDNAEKGQQKDDKDSKAKPGNDGGQKKKEEGKKSSPSKSSRRRNKRKNAAAAAAAAAANNNHLMGDRPPAIKLHIGNLAYSTAPSTLFDFFAAMCGRESVLECHIPTERDTGRSRGFGFVTLPEPIARQILKSGKKHEVDGRPLKIAESNSAGAGKTGARVPMPPPSMASGERCVTCGYRPKYCVCRIPNIPGFGGPPPPPPPPPPPHMLPHGPPMDMVEYGRDYDYYGGGGSRRFRDDRFGPPNVPPYDRPRPPPGDRDRPPYGRDLERDQWGYRYDEPRSRSYDRIPGDDRVRDRGRRDGKRSRSRTRSRSRSRSPRGSRRGRERDPDRRWEHRRSSSRSRSRSYSSGSSRSRSPPPVKREHDPLGPSPRKEKKGEAVAGKDHIEDARAGVNPPSSGSKPPRENRKRSHSRSGGRKKKKSKRRPARSRSRSRSRSPSPRGA